MVSWSPRDECASLLESLHLSRHLNAERALAIDFEKKPRLSRSGRFSSKTPCKAYGRFNEVAVASGDTSIRKASTAFEADPNSIEIICNPERHRPELPFTRA